LIDAGADAQKSQKSPVSFSIPISLALYIIIILRVLFY
jgi:hypothetical protein